MRLVTFGAFVTWVSAASCGVSVSSTARDAAMDAGHDAVADVGDDETADAPVDEGPCAPDRMQCDWSGEWSTGLGRTVLVQTGRAVTGRFERNDGGVTGYVVQNRLLGDWTETRSPERFCPWGPLYLTMAPDCRSFWGELIVCSDDAGFPRGTVSGTRISGPSERTCR